MILGINFFTLSRSAFTIFQFSKRCSLYSTHLIKFKSFLFFLSVRMIARVNFYVIFQWVQSSHHLVANMALNNLLTLPTFMVAEFSYVHIRFSASITIKTLFVFHRMAAVVYLAGKVLFLKLIMRHVCWKELYWRLGNLFINRKFTKSFYNKHSNILQCITKIKIFKTLNTKFERKTGQGWICFFTTKNLRL